MTEANLVEIRQRDQQAGVAQNALDNLIDTAAVLGNQVLVEDLEHALAEARRVGLEAEEQLEGAGALPE